MSKKETAIGKNHYHTNHKTKKRHRPRSKSASSDPRANSYILVGHIGFGENHYKPHFEKPPIKFGQRVKNFFRKIFFKKTVKAPSVESQTAKVRVARANAKPMVSMKVATRIHQRKGER